MPGRAGGRRFDLLHAVGQARAGGADIWIPRQAVSRFRHRLATTHANPWFHPLNPSHRDAVDASPIAVVPQPRRKTLPSFHIPKDNEVPTQLLIPTSPWHSWFSFLYHRRLRDARKKVKESSAKRGPFSRWPAATGEDGGGAGCGAFRGRGRASAAHRRGAAMWGPGQRVCPHRE